MTFVFLIFRNNTRGRIARSSKIEGLKGMMGCPKQEGVSPVKGHARPAEGENKRGKKLSLWVASNDRCSSSVTVTSVDDSPSSATTLSIVCFR